MSELHKCPVCNGKGIVPSGFYNPSDFSTTDATQETCRSCDGRGYIILDSSYPYSDNYEVTIFELDGSYHLSDKIKPI